MINPVGTEAKRKAALDDLVVAVLGPDEKATARCLTALRPALAGLDIAEVAMRGEAAILATHRLIKGDLEFDFRYYNAAIRAQREALRRWQAWTNRDPGP